MATNKEITTAFQYGEDAKNPNGSFYVENIDGVIIAFSYGPRFPICVKFDDGVLFNTDGYSNTTARHKNLILSTLGELNDDDKSDTKFLINVVDKVRYDGVRSKAELIEAKI